MTASSVYKLEKIMNIECELEMGNHLWTCDVAYDAQPFERPARGPHGEPTDPGCPASLDITDITVEEVSIYHGDECVRTVRPTLKNRAQLGQFLMEKFDIGALEEEILENAE